MFAFGPSSFPAAAGLFGFTAGSTTTVNKRNNNNPVLITE